MDGRLPNAYCADEVGALPTNYPVEAMRSGQLNILNKLGFIISTKYPTIDNPFESEVEYAKKVLDGLVADVQTFANGHKKLFLALVFGLVALSFGFNIVQMVRICHHQRTEKQQVTAIEHQEHLLQKNTHRINPQRHENNRQD